MPTITEFRVARDDLKRTTVAHRDVDLGDGKVLCRVDRFALTANNITYAAHGVDMKYWDFFPAPAGWGIVPVWGFADVIQSRCPGVAVGVRAYGYWPMADHVVLAPVKVSAKGFVDGAAHRSGLAAVYNGYQVVDGDVGDERAYALFRPLFLTSFLLSDVYGDAPETFVLSSASSKTALGMAHGLRAKGRTVIGLTSAGNVDFARASGVYSSVVAYDALASVALGPTIYIDFAGDRTLRRAVHTHFGDDLVQSIVVGDTHVGKVDGDGALPGVRPEFFFAPTHLVSRIRDHAPGGFNDRYAASWAEFLTATAPWLRYIEAGGADAVTAHYAAMVAGRVDPAEGIILRLRA
jgi:hypothetical protein